jgi:hypothetical protein
MTDDTGKNRKKSIAGRFRRLLAPEGGCGCCGGVKVVPKKADEKKE